MKKCLILSLILSSVLVFSCSNVIEESGLKRREPIELAKDYIHYEMFWDNLFAGRELNSTESYPEYFRNIEIVDENNEKVDFDSLSEENKKAAYDLWKENEISTIVERISEDEQLYDILAMELAAMSRTEQTAERKLISNDESELKWLMKKYMKYRQEEYKKFEKTVAREDKARSSSSGSSNDSSGSSATSSSDEKWIPDGQPLVESSVNILKSLYAPGKIFVCMDDSSGSSAANSGGNIPFVGHAAIMSEDKWQNKWDKDSGAKASVSAWALEKNSIKWKGKINGAQYEPIGYWAGNFPGSARKVKVFHMQRIQIVWNWIFFHFEVLPAPANEAQSAVAYARNLADQNILNGNHPYDIGWSIASQASALQLNTKWWPSTCYCSHLVWRSWVNANLLYDYSGLFDLILPWNIALSPNVSQEAYYCNW